MQTRPVGILTPLRAQSGTSVNGPDVEQQLSYLQLAFFGFMKAKESSEMQQLGRVICAILEMSPDEQIIVNESIVRMTTGVIVTHSLDSLTSNIASLWGFR